MKRLLMSILMSIIFITANSYAAGIKKWVDEGGQTHYGDSPPSRTNTESVKVSKPPSNPGRPLPRFNPVKDAEEEAAEQPDEQAEAKQPEEERDEEFCKQARRELRILRSSKRIRLKTSDGGTRHMTREAIKLRREQTKEDIEKFCN